MLLVPQTAATTWRVPINSALVCLLFSLGSWSYSVYKEWCFFFFFFFSSSFFSSVCHIPCGQGGGGTTVCFFQFFIILFRLVFFDFVFFLCFLSFLYFIGCVCRACRIQYDGMALHSPLCLLHTWQRSIRGTVVSLWRSFVTTELVYLLGLRNRHEHWLC